MAKDFYYAPNKHYYKSQEIYEKDKKEKEYFNRAKGIVYYDFLGYKPGEPAPPNYIMKGFNELVSYYGAKVVLLTIGKCHDRIMWIVNNKEFKTFAGKANYIIAILKGEIKNVANKEAKKEKNKHLEQSSEYRVVDVDQSVHVKKANDISDFIEEDE